MAEIREGRTYYGPIWVEGEYSPPLYPSALNVRVGEPGVKVIDVIKYLRASHDNVDEVLDAWAGDLTRDDIDAALAFYAHSKPDRDEIELRLKEEAAAAA